MNEHEHTQVALQEEIASLRQQLAQAEASESHWRRLLEAAPDALVVIDPKKGMVFVNTQTEQLFGYTHQELLGQPIEMLMPENARGMHQKHRRDYCANPHIRPMGTGLDLHGLRKDGTSFPIDISLSPVSTEEGLLILSAIRDISARKRLEDVFERQREWLSLTLANLGEAVITTDPNLAITFMNREAEKLTRWTLEEAAWRDIREVLPGLYGETDLGIDHAIQRVLQGERRETDEQPVVLRAHDGRAVFTVTSIAAIRSREEVVHGAVLVLQAS